MNKYTDDLYIKLFQALSRVDKAIRSKLDEANHDFAPSSLQVLLILFEEDGQHPSKLAQKTGRLTTSFTPIIDALEYAKYIERKPSKKDRRAVHIYLTEKGKALKEEFLQISREAKDNYTSGLSEMDMETLEGLLQKFIDAE